MSKFAPVVPMPVARVLWDADYLGGYHLLLAHDVVSSPTIQAAYQQLYGYDVPRKFQDSCVIMDNSVVELGETFNFEDCLTAANTVNADYLVAADCFLDHVATMKRSTEFLNKFAAQVEFAAKLKLMGVVQGSTLDECMECAGMYARNTWFGAIAVPRCLTPVLGSRMQVLMQIQKRFAGRFKNIHMLGFSDNLIDDVCCARLPFVSGIDSAAPIRGALQGIKFQLPVTDFGPRGNFWLTGGMQAEAALPTIIDNLSTVRQLIYSGN